jgi:hypothetical protein
METAIFILKLAGAWLLGLALMLFVFRRRF